MPSLNRLQTGSSIIDATPHLCHHWRINTPSRTSLVQGSGRNGAQRLRWQPSLCHMRHRLQQSRTVRSKCSQSEDNSEAEDILQEQDTNRLTTALNIAIAAEDYGLAAHIRDRLAELTGSDSEATADWTKLGVPEWLAERAERIGYRFPTGGNCSSTDGCNPASAG